MIKAHSPINWENEPSYNTPINEENLNKMDSTIGILDDRIIEQDTVKLDKSVANTMVSDVSFDDSTGIFTVTLLNGSTKTLDTKLEKIATNFRYDYSTQTLILTLIDGTTQSIDMSALVTQFEFTDSDTLDFSVSNDGKITATIKNGSITEDMLQPNYLAEIKVETEKSAQSMANAQISENNAKQSELNAKASEEQALEYSNNAQPLAQSVSGNNPTATNSADGNVIYLNNKGYTQQDGTPPPDTPIRIESNGDKGYFDGGLLQGGYLSSNGSYSSSYKYMVCSANGIPCKEGDSIQLTYEEKAVHLQLYFYGADGFISYQSADNTDVVTAIAPSGTTYCHIRIDKATTETLSPSTAKHICVTINGMYALRVKTQGVWDGELQKGYHKVADGTYGSNDTHITNVNVIECKSDDVVKVKYEESVSVLSLVFYDDNKIFISSEHTSNAKEFEATAPTNAKYVNFTIGKDTALSPSTAKDILVTINGQGSVGKTTAFIPISSPLYDGDYIELYADGSGQIVRNSKSVVYNGSDDEGWKVSGANSETNRYNYEIVLGDSKANVNAYCTHLPYYTWNEMPWDATNKEEYRFSISTGKTIIVYTTGIATLADFKAWLAENKPQFLYELATPTSTPLTAEQVAEFMKLQTFKGVTHVNADGEVTVRYYCDNASGETVSMLQGMIEETKVDAQKQIEEIKFQSKQVQVHTDKLSEWKKIDSGLGVSLIEICYGNGVYVAKDQNNIYYSTDLVTWNRVQGSQSSNIVFGNNRFVSVGGHNHYSYDGITWFASPSDIQPKAGNSVVFGNGKFIFIAYDTIYSSNDGILWKIIDFPGTFIDISYGNGKFVILGSSGKTFYSTDGEIWNETIRSGRNSHTDITFANGRFVLVGSNGVHPYYSIDGETWIEVTDSGLDSDLNTFYSEVEYGNGFFVCMNNLGKSYCSRDGGVWSEIIDSNLVLPSGKNSWKLIYVNGRFLGVCYDSNIYYLDFKKEQRNLEDVINELYSLLRA